MSPRETLLRTYASIEAQHRQATHHRQDLVALAEDTSARLRHVLARYAAVLPTLGAGANPALERMYGERLMDQHRLTLAREAIRHGAPL